MLLASLVFGRAGLSAVADVHFVTVWRPQLHNRAARGEKKQEN
jgi:hypothetical protein